MNETHVPEHKKKQVLKIGLIILGAVVVIAVVGVAATIKYWRTPSTLGPVTAMTRVKVAALPISVPNPIPKIPTPVPSAAQDMQVALVQEENPAPVPTEVTMPEPTTWPPPVQEGSVDDSSMEAPAKAINTREKSALAPLSDSAADKEARFAIQVGVFYTKAYADKKVAELNQLGYSSFIHEVMSKDQRPLYLACVGRFHTRAEATRSMAAFEEKEKIKAVIALLEPR